MRNYAEEFEFLEWETDEIDLETSASLLRAQGTAFLESYGFPPDEEHLRLLGSYIQSLPNNVDSFRPLIAAKSIRRMKIAHAAYFGLIKPPTDEQDTAKSPPVDMERKA